MSPVSSGMDVLHRGGTHSEDAPDLAQRQLTPETPDHADLQLVELRPRMILTTETGMAARQPAPTLSTTIMGEPDRLLPGPGDPR